MRLATLCLAAAFAVVLAHTAAAQLPADNVIMRTRVICNQGQGGQLLASFDFKPRANMWPPNYGRIGGFTVTFAYTSTKLTLQGVQPRYEQGYWGIYRTQAYGVSAWFNQHAHNGYPQNSLPVDAQYFSRATDCTGNSLNDNYFELMRYEFTIGATASGTVNLNFVDVQAYNTISYQANVQHTAIFSPDLTYTMNDSVFTVKNLIIPVDLASFNVTPQHDGTMALTWHTATETSNRGFDVERGDGTTFERIAFIDGHGTTTAGRDYNFVDENPVPAADGQVHYRLRQVDMDGTESYSQVVSAVVTPQVVGLEDSYPNPVSVGGLSRVPYTLAVPGTVTLAVYNTLGQHVATLVNGESRTAGRHTAQWNTRGDAGSPLPAGMYYLRFTARLDGGQEVQATRQMAVIR
jgi:hypothetical protein